MNNRAKKGLRRTLWELLNPKSRAFSPVIASFANIDFAAARREVRIYQEGLTAMAIAACCFAWHQTMAGTGTWQAPVPAGLNRAEVFLLHELMKYGHLVAINQLQQLAGTPECKSTGAAHKVRHKAT